MDEIKETLADAIGSGAANIADELGRAAVNSLIATAHEILASGCDVVVEGFFQASTYQSSFQPIINISQGVLVHMVAADDILKSRYEQRAMQDVRHWIHADREKLGSLAPELPEHMAEMLQLGIPQLIIDTSHNQLNIVATARLIEHALQTPTPRKSA